MRASRLWQLAAVSLIAATPVVAQAQATRATSPASSLSLVGAPARAGATMTRQNRLEGNAGWIIGAIGVIAGVTYAFVEGNDDSDPETPVSN